MKKMMVIGGVCAFVMGVSAAAWGSPYEESPLWKWHYDLDLIRNLRDVVHDMGLEDFNDTGTYRD